MKHCIALCLLAWLAVGIPMAQASGGGGPESLRRPNIVLLLADDWGFSDVGAFGSEIATPHLDALAKRGARFSNFHVSASCSPTRSMLLTGVDNHRNGVGNMRETIPQSHLGKPGYLSVLDRNVVTVATLLRDSGYRTYMTGKWHLGKEPHNLPNQRGFGRSLIQADSGSDNWETSQQYLDLADKVYWFEDGKPASMPKDYYSSEFFVDKAISYLRADAAKTNAPFFTYIAFQANHIPVQAPQAYIDKYKGKYKEGWTALREARRQRASELGLIPAGTRMRTEPTSTDWNRLSEKEKLYEQRRMEVYAAMAEAMDHHVGRLVQHLKDSGDYDNTVFLFLSDNGPEASDPYSVTLGRLWLGMNYTRDIDRLGGKGAFTAIGPSWGSAAAAPLSTYKFYSGEGGIRVPLIIAGIKGMAQEQIQGSFVHVNDIAPTLLELAGVTPPAGSYRGNSVESMVGRSLMPVLTGQSTQVHPSDAPIGYELSGNQALFKGDLKLIKNIPPLGDGQWHLYDIRRDPGETEDLQAALPQQFAAMQADYAQWAKANGVLPMPEGYDPIKQVIINSIVHVYLPRLQKAALPALAGLLALGFLWHFLRRRRSPSPQGID